MRLVPTEKERIESAVLKCVRNGSGQMLRLETALNGRFGIVRIRKMVQSLIDRGVIKYEDGRLVIVEGR